jgi:hypothetical protein
VGANGEPALGLAPDESIEVRAAQHGVTIPPKPGSPPFAMIKATADAEPVAPSERPGEPTRRRRGRITADVAVARAFERVVAVSGEMTATRSPPTPIGAGPSMPSTRRPVAVGSARVCAGSGRSGRA